MFPYSDSSDDTEAAAVIALLRRGDRLWHHYAATIESAGSALAVLSGEYEDDNPHSLQLFPQPAPLEVDLEPIIKEIASWRAEGIEIVTILSTSYPTNLRTIHNRPPILFSRGRLHPEDDRSIAVVGTRTPSPAATALSDSFAADIADAGYTVVSGLAAGIDTAAHLAALRRGVRTVAIIGTGLRRAYPPENAGLQERLANEAAVISQFWPDAPPTKQSFPMRNVVMSGFALATVVIEASDVSGARMQARFALEHGRPVFLLESLLQYEWARDYAARPGAHVVQSADEVLSRVDRLWSLDVLSA